MISEKEASKFRSLEEILAVILRFWHGQKFSSLARLIVSWTHELCQHTHSFICIKSICGCSIFGAALCIHRPRSHFGIELAEHLLVVAIVVVGRRPFHLAVQQSVLDFAEATVETCVANARLDCTDDLAIQIAFDFDSDSFSQLDSFVVSFHHFVSCLKSRCLNYILLVIFFPLLSQDGVQQIVAGVSVHLEHFVCHDILHLARWSVVDQIPVCV